MAQAAIQEFPSVSQTLSTLFVKKGLLSFDQIDVAKKEQALQGNSFEECLVNLGFISHSALAEVLSETSGYKEVDLKQTLFDPSLKHVVPQEVAEKFCLFPLRLENGTLEVAIADVYNMAAFESLQHTIPAVRNVVPFIAPEAAIRESLDLFYGYDLSFKGLLRELEGLSPTSPHCEAAINPTVRFVNAVLMDGIKRRASDIHFEPEGQFMRLRYRIDGLLYQVCTLHVSYWPAISVRLKVMAQMNITEIRRPQNGRISYFLGPREVDLRVSTHPTIHGENIVIRILDKDNSIIDLTGLGYSNLVIERLKVALERPLGIIIITGPTGCGKTTSLYSILNHISRPELNIMTLEEPVEYQFPFIRQSNMQEESNFTFAEGVRSILRQDPDIILIGEVRDTNTAQMALRAAMTGHQVFTTLHTNDALGALPRFLDLGISPSLLASNLVAIIAQRLVRRLCTICKVKREMTPFEAILLRCKEQTPIFTSKGCSKCRKTGYYGRFAIAEVLVFDKELDNLLVEGASRKTIEEVALKNGFVTMQEDARQRILKGDTSIEEVSRIIDLKEVL